MQFLPASKLEGREAKSEIGERRDTTPRAADGHLHLSALGTSPGAGGSAAFMVSSNITELSLFSPVLAPQCACNDPRVYRKRRRSMNGVIYIIGLIVVIMLVLSFLGLR